MLIIPAIDLKDGTCVRLVEGRLGTERRVANDPVEQACAFQEAGAKRLHVVDLDGAFEGSPRNATTIANIAKAVSIPVQLGGGLRSAEIVRGVLSAGVSYAILGTMAVENPDLFRDICAEHPNRIIAGIDVKAGKVATEGWVGETERTGLEVAKEAEAAGAHAVISTDILRDGTGLGVNVEHTEALATAISIPVFASGGVSGLDDVRALAKTKVAGVIIGKAIYDGELDLVRAFEIAKAEK